ncbi:RteC domain-containing protein [Sphingobacterium sp. MYb382]|uniref:RteC domain-containing protein n=1 Tax=Sphingobacterium sp. MYb382 TaxID=2745278 RepID=UPI003095FF9A
MDKFYKKAREDLENKIKELTYEQDNSLLFYEKAIEVVLRKTAELKVFVLKTGFISEKEEIHFFKHVKPVFVASLIYHNAIYKIETKKPYGAKPIRKYLKKELKKLKRFFDNNLDFYMYYRSNNSFLDEKYFVRGKQDIQLCVDTVYFQSDMTFSTSHDYKVAKIMANDLIQVYIEDKLYKNTEQVELSKDMPRLNWTGTKASLIELIYALHYQGALDNGKNDIRKIAKYSERVFGIDLGNFYQTYLELRNRKINRTKFLDALREELLRRMGEQDEK